MIGSIKAMGNRELLELFKLMVKTDHYDPVETPEAVVVLREAGVETDDLEEIIMSRMAHG